MLCKKWNIVVICFALTLIQSFIGLTLQANDGEDSTEMDNIDPDDVKAIKGIPNLLYVDHDTNYIVCYTTLWSQVDSIVEDFARLVHVPFSKWRRDPPNFGVRVWNSSKAVVDMAYRRKDAKTDHDFLPIVPFHGIPVSPVSGITVLDCHYGPLRYAKRNEKLELARQEAMNSDHPSAKKRRIRTVGCCKLSCSAKIEMKEVFVFPDISIQSDLSAVHIMGNLRRAIQSGGGYNQPQHRIYIRFPRPLAHSGHVMDAMIGQYNRIHKALREKCFDMVLHGVTTRADMRRHLKIFVRDKYPNASIADTAYYPNNKSISDAIYEGRLRQRYDKIDEKNVEIMINKWREVLPQDFFYYRPKTKEDDLDNITLNDEDDVLHQVPSFSNKKLKSSLLYIHQSYGQREILKRYGHIVLMDATYRTCRLALPLFIMAVKTNVAYLSVATFIVQTEDAASIAEALSILKKEWDKEGINVPNFMIDSSAAEIWAIDKVFPDSTIWLCDFHRAQAWLRWLRTTNNGCAHKCDEVKDQMTKIAHSLTETEFIRNQQDFKNTYLYKKNKKLQAYYHRWEVQKERWCLAWRHSIGLYIHTNNGLERMNSHVRNVVLQRKTDNTLSDLLMCLVTCFIPTWLKWYVTQNAVMGNRLYPRMKKSIPWYLINRPPYFVKHCLQTLIKAGSEFDPSMIHTTDHPKIYKVGSSLDASKYYTVDFSGITTKCSCPEWSRTEMPCKHTFAILQHSALVTWNDLPEEFRNNPLFIVDEQASRVLKHSTGVAHEMLLLSQRMEQQLSGPLSAAVDDDIPLSQLPSTPDVEQLVTVEDINDDENNDDDADNSQRGPENFSTFPFTRRIREVCDLIGHASHEAKDGKDYDICKATCDQLYQIFERFTEGLSNQNGLIELRNKKFRTLKQLSRDSRTFQGRRLESVPRRSAMKKKNIKRRNFGDSVGMAQVNQRIQELKDIGNIVEKSPQIIENELWGHSEAATDTQMEQAYLNVSGDIYMHELDKLKLKQSLGPAIENDDAPGECVMSDAQKQDLEKIVDQDMSEVANNETVTIRKRQLESAIHYVVAIVKNHIIYDFDLLPLQALSWQTHVLMGAYLDHLCSTFTTTLMYIKQLPMLPMKNILNGVYRTDPKFMRSPLFLADDEHKDFAESDLLLGAYHVRNNHWCLIMIDMQQKELLYLDPKAPADVEYQQAVRCAQQWSWFGRIWNNEKAGPHVPEHFRAKTLNHARQDTYDYNNCGLYCLTFAKRILMGRDLTNINPGDEGAIISYEIKQASQMTNHCVKCGIQCNDGPYTLCAQGCGRYFHRKCVSDKYKHDEYVTCAICDPSRREEYCQVCGKGVGRGSDGDILECVEKCEAFVHKYCIPGGTNNYRCGICTL